MGNTWIAIFDIVAGCVLLAFTLLARLRPHWLLKQSARPTPERMTQLDRGLTDRARIEEHLRRGDTLQAVREYMRQTGAAPPEAGQAIRAMAGTANVPRKVRPSGLILSTAAWALPLLLIALGIAALL